MGDKILEEYYSKGFEFLFTSPLYSTYSIDTKIKTESEEEILTEATEDRAPDIVSHDNYYESDDFSFIKALIFTKTEVISYCPLCGKEEIIYLEGKEIQSELKGKKIHSYSYMGASEECDFAYSSALEKWDNRLKYFINNSLDKNRNFIITATCKKEHRFQSIFHITDNYNLIKIGQYPSRMEFERYVKEYNKVLSKVDNRELNTAIGLVTHGVGAGAFVYLRRVFERVVFDTFNKELKDKKEITLEEFTDKTMEDKIKFLKVYFDDSINKKLLYGILSKGVHELSDEECKEYFNIVLSALIIILEKQLEKKSKVERQNEVNKLINNTHMKLKTKQ